MLRSPCMLFAIFALVQSAPAHSSAQALPLKTSARLGRPARPVTVTVSETEQVVLNVGGASASLPARGVKAATVEPIAVAEDAFVAVVRVSAENGEWTALLGGKSGSELLFAGRTDLTGDPGERRAHVVELAAGARPGTTNVTVSTRYEGLTHCQGAAPWLVDTRALDPTSLKLVTQRALPALGAPPNALELTVPEGEPSKPALSALDAVASTQVEESTRMLRVPRAAVDGRSETVWSAAPGDVALFRWSAPSLPIERIELQLKARSGKEAPAALVFITDKAAYRAAMPSGTGERYQATLPAPVSTRCLEIAVERPGSQAPLEIAELRVGTELDRPEGLARLVSSLVQDGEQGAEATTLLVQLGAPAAQAVAARFGELSARAQRRALRVLASALDAPEVRAPVLAAARSKDEEVSGTAIAVLSRGKEPGLMGLRELVLFAEPAGDAAARALSLTHPPESAALLAALATPAGADRPALRRSLMAVARRDERAFLQAVESWLASAPPLSARVALAMVSAAVAQPQLATRLAEGALEPSATFADRFRIAITAPQLQASSALDGWLGQQVQGAEEWMVRRAAYDALVARAPGAAQGLAPQVIQDPYPRVRAGATGALAAAGKRDALEQVARRDEWPLVRAAAASALGELPEARPALEQLLDDSSRRVRAAAIDALGVQRASQSWPLVEQRLSAANEWPEVQAAAVRFAATLCVQSARAPLTYAARRGLRPDASDDERQLSLEALYALHALGGQAAEDARRMAARESSSPQLQQAIARLGPSRCAVSVGGTAARQTSSSPR